MPSGFQLTLLMGPVTFQPVPRAVLDSLIKVQATNSAGDRSGFQLTFSYSKRSEMERKLSSGFFDPPTRVILVATINGQPNVIMDGVITRHELQISNEPGQSTLTITGMDLTQVMDMVDFSFMIWPAMPREARVAIILAKYALYNIVPVVIPSVLIDVPVPILEIPAQQGTDYEYVRSLADDVGYTFYVEPGFMPGQNFGYWGPEIKFGAPQRALTVNSDHVSNVDAMNFSFDGFAKTLYILYIHNKETKVSFPVPVPDITPLNPPLGSKIPMPLKSRFLNREGSKDSTAKYLPLQAAARAIARASQTSDVVTASGSLDVLRYGGILKARSLVGVRGAGPDYNGYYFVKSVTHSIQRGEYKQSFSLTRNARVHPFSKVLV